MSEFETLSDQNEITRLCLQVVNDEKQQYSAEHSEPNVNDDQQTNPFSSADIAKALSKNEDGDAELYVELHRYLFCYDTAAGCWYKWSGHFWQEDILNDALRSIDAVVAVYGMELDRLSWEQQKEVLNGSGNN